VAPDLLSSREALCSKLLGEGHPEWLVPRACEVTLTDEAGRPCVLKSADGPAAESARTLKVERLAAARS
jgi:hypothetical protein